MIVSYWKEKKKKSVESANCHSEQSGISGKGHKKRASLSIPCWEIPPPEREKKRGAGEEALTLASFSIAKKGPRKKTKLSYLSRRKKGATVRTGLPDRTKGQRGRNGAAHSDYPGWKRKGKKRGDLFAYENRGGGVRVLKAQFERKKKKMTQGACSRTVETD